MAGWCLQGKGVSVFGGKVWARAVGLGLVGVVMAGCAGPVAELTPTPVVTTSKTPSPSGPASLSDAELYALAVSQYEKLFAIINEIELQGGAISLPDAARTVLMDPAWSAVDDEYRGMLLSGDRYSGTPRFGLDAVARLTPNTVPEGTLVALETCESSQGAALVATDGTIVHDESLVIINRRAYFRLDVDGQLKVFILNGEAVETCQVK